MDSLTAPSSLRHVLESRSKSPPHFMQGTFLTASFNVAVSSKARHWTVLVLGPSTTSTFEDFVAIVR